MRKVVSAQRKVNPKLNEMLNFEVSSSLSACLSLSLLVNHSFSWCSDTEPVIDSLVAQQEQKLRKQSKRGVKTGASCNLDSYAFSTLMVAVNYVTLLKQLQEHTSREHVNARMVDDTLSLMDSSVKVSYTSDRDEDSSNRRGSISVRDSSSV